MARLGAGSAAESALPGGSAALRVRGTALVTDSAQAELVRRPHYPTTVLRCRYAEPHWCAGLGSVVFGALELPTCPGSGCKAHDRSSTTAELKNGPVLFDVRGGHAALARLIHRVLF